MRKMFILIVFLSSLSGFSKNLFFSDPAITPDGEKIVFCLKGDLWIVDKEGGSAYRLTSLDGVESNPSISPDGHWIAFSSNSEGNNDVYVMPVKGGEIKKLTYHSASDLVNSWSWDSQYIYFTSNRYNNFTGFKVSLTGGTPERLLKGYFNTIHETVESPIDKSIYFTDTWESYVFRNRKKYKGTYNPEIKSYNFKTNDFVIHTNYPGKDFNPVFDKAGHLYFLSDRFNDEMNLYEMNNGKADKLTDFNSSIRNFSISASGNYIVFEKDYLLYLFDTKTKNSREIGVNISEKDELAVNKTFNVNEKITDFDISDDGKKIAFVSRGLLFVSDEEGKYLKRIKTVKSERVGEVKWLSDSETLLYSRTSNGYYNWFKISAKENEKEVQLTKVLSNERNITLNSDKTQAVYLRGRKNLVLMNLKDYKSNVIINDYFWGFYNSSPYFSPDDKYIVYTAYRDFEQDMFVYDLENKKILNILETGVSESSPTWSEDGKYIYFSTDRTHPGFPRGTEHEKIYRLPLYKFDNPFKIDYLSKVFEKEKPKNKDKKDEVKGKNKKVEDKIKVKLDLENAIERLEQVSKGEGQQSSPYVFNDKEKSYVFYISSEKNGKPALFKTTYEPFEENKSDIVKGTELGYRGFGDFKIIKKKDKYYSLLGGKINTLNVVKNMVTPMKISFDFEKNMKEEFRQMFYQVWADVNENFYDEEFHGVNWEKMKLKYENYLPFVSSRNDLRVLLNDMLLELNASHMGFRTYGSEEKTFYSKKSVSFGIEFNDKNPYVVENILKYSPADNEDVNIKKGDILISVNGDKVNFQENREKYFSFSDNMDEFQIAFKRGDKLIETKIHSEPALEISSRLYDQWIDDNQNLVDKLSDKKVAYIHMKDMGEESLSHFLIEMTSESYKKEGLILDLRNNMGGNVHDDVLSFLSQKLYSYWSYRGDKKAAQPNFYPASKPIVLLVNKLTLSDGEMTAAGFQALKLGKVVGTETYRWLIFTSSMSLVDGSYHRMPSWGCYKIDGTDIEKSGVTPDIIVPLTVKDKELGKDPQIEKAVEVVLKQLK